MFKKPILVIVFMMTVILGLSSCGKGTSTDSLEGSALVVASISYNGDLYEVVADKYGGLVELKNGEKTNTKLSGSYNGDLLKLPETKDMEDLSNRGLIGENIYETSLVDAAKYLNYLESNEYTIEFSARTYKFIELYAKGLSEDLQRIIITKDYMVVTDADEIPELDIKNYIFN